MVPWHMQLKYLPNNNEGGESHKPKKKKWRKKYVKKKSKSDHTIDEETNDGATFDGKTKDTEGTDHTQFIDTGDHAHSSTKDLSTSDSGTDHTHSSTIPLQGFKTYYRYYHVFCDGELRSLCEDLPEAKVIDCWYDHENWCVLLEKKQ